MNLSDLLKIVGMYLTTPVNVEVVRRCPNGTVTHKAIVPITHIKPDFDDKGIVIRIEESEVKMEEYR